MSLRDWVSNRWLVEHQTTQGEIGDLLALADRDLKDCQAQGLSADARLRLAYNAALQAATAALAAAGYRTGRGESHHYRVIQTVAHIIGAEASVVDEFDAYRKKRNMADYERAGAASDREATEAIEFARWLRRQVKDWLRANHPSFLGK
jgi:hypothetical protein